MAVGAFPEDEIAAQAVNIAGRHHLQYVGQRAVRQSGWSLKTSRPLNVPLTVARHILPEQRMVIRTAHLERAGGAGIVHKVEVDHLQVIIETGDGQAGLFLQARDGKQGEFIHHIDYVLAPTCRR